MQKTQGESCLSVIVETCNVDEKSETSETEVDVITMDSPILDNSSYTSRLVEEPAHMGIPPYRFGSISNLELAVLKMEKRRRGEEFQEEAKRLQSSKRLDHTYTFSPAHIEQRRLPLHSIPTPTIGW
jgi:hypothetical protein